MKFRMSFYPAAYLAIKTKRGNSKKIMLIVVNNANEYEIPMNQLCSFYFISF